MAGHEPSFKVLAVCVFVDASMLGMIPLWAAVYGFAALLDIVVGLAEDWFDDCV